MGISSIEISNLKSINRLKMECAELNVFIGPNSAGKSTIQQSVLLVGQNMTVKEGLNGSLIQLGNLEENRCRYSKEKKIEVSLTADDGTSIVKKVVPIDNRYEIETQIEGDCTYETWNDRLNIKNRKLQYLSCHRIGPRNVYEKNMTLDDVIGVDGEYTMSYLNNHGGDLLDMPLCKGSVDYTLLGQVNWWLSYITDTTITIEDILGTNLVKVSYQMYDMDRIRPDNIGSGISYLISVLVMCLSSPQNGIVDIENPEIHLHPSAQAKVCEFLYFISCTGRQVFVETHSDHIFNGFRVGIATDAMKKDNINIQFVYLNEQHVTEAMKVLIGRMGRIENQRKDLFDQFDIDLNRMIGL